jgi:hypothetical protein
MQPALTVKLDKKLDSFSARGVPVDEFHMQYAAKDPRPAGTTAEQVDMQMKALHTMWGENGMNVMIGCYDQSVVEVINAIST